MADLSKITLPSGSTYNIKDADARERISALESYTNYLGVTTTPIEDGSTTNPVVIAGESITAKHGEIVNYGSGEFIWNGNIQTPCWQEFGDMSALGDFAYVDTGALTIKPKGQNSSSSVSFTEHTRATVLKDTVTATVPKTQATSSYLSASSSNVGINVTEREDAVLGYNPSKEEFIQSYSGSTKKLATTSIPNVTSAGNAASWTATVENETLTFSWTPNTPATLGTAITAATGKVANSDTSGDDVMVGLGTPSKKNALTALGTPDTASLAKTVVVSAQPNITLSTSSTASTGAVEYVSGVEESGTNNVTFNKSGNTAGAIVELGEGTAAAQTFNGTQEAYTVTPVTN